MARPARRAAVETVEPLWDTAQVMARLGMSETWVRRHKAELGVRKVGAALRFRREDVLAYEDRARLQAPSPAPPPQIAEERQRRRPALKHTTAVNPLDNKPW